MQYNLFRTIMNITLRPSLLHKVTFSNEPEFMTGTQNEEQSWSLLFYLNEM